MLRLDLSKVPANQSLHLSGDYPLAWAKMYGKGRVFYGSFAHSSETWDNKDIQQMYLEAIVVPRPLGCGTEAASDDDRAG